MKDAAYLLATLDQLQHTVALIDAQTCEFNDDIWIKYTAQNKTNNKSIVNETVHFNAKDLANTLSYDWDEIKQRVDAFKKILNFNVQLNEDIYYCCYLDWKQRVSEQVRYAEIDGRQLRYRWSRSTKLVQVEYDVDKVLGAEALLDGLKILDYAGSHYTVLTPAKKEHLTTYSRCSCREFLNSKRCSHNKLVKLLPEYRRLLIETKLLVVKF